MNSDTVGRWSSRHAALLVLLLLVSALVGYPARADCLPTSQAHYECDYYPTDNDWEFSHNATMSGNGIAERTLSPDEGLTQVLAVVNVTSETEDSTAEAWVTLKKSFVFQDANGADHYNNIKIWYSYKGVTQNIPNATNRFQVRAQLYQGNTLLATDYGANKKDYTSDDPLEAREEGSMTFYALLEHGKTYRIEMRALARATLAAGEEGSATVDFYQEPPEEFSVRFKHIKVWHSHQRAYTDGPGDHTEFVAEKSSWFKQDQYAETDGFSAQIYTDDTTTSIAHWEIFIYDHKSASSEQTGDTTVDFDAETGDVDTVLEGEDIVVKGTLYFNSSSCNNAMGFKNVSWSEASKSGARREPEQLIMVPPDHHWWILDPVETPPGSGQYSHVISIENIDPLHPLHIQELRFTSSPDRVQQIEEVEFAETDGPCLDMTLDAGSLPYVYNFMTTGDFSGGYIYMKYEIVDDNGEVISVSWGGHAVGEVQPGGAVPDGFSDMPLTVEKDPSGDLVLEWAPSCMPGDTDYAIYWGNLGNLSAYDHEPLTDPANACTTSGLTTATIIPPQGDNYFIVVPNNGTAEGSYGLDGDGNERPPSAIACHVHAVGPCP